MNSKLTGEGVDDVKKKLIAIFTYSDFWADMKTKVVQQNERLKEWESEWKSDSWFPAFVWRSDIF